MWHSLWIYDYVQQGQQGIHGVRQKASNLQKQTQSRLVPLELNLCNLNLCDERRHHTHKLEEDQIARKKESR